MCHQFWQAKTLNSIMLHIIPVSHGFLTLCGENLRWHIKAASKELDGCHSRLLGKRACSWSRIDCHGILDKYHEADNSTTTQLICDIDNTPSYLVVWSLLAVSVVSAILTEDPREGRVHSEGYAAHRNRTINFHAWDRCGQIRPMIHRSSENRCITLLIWHANRSQRYYSYGHLRSDAFPRRLGRWKPSYLFVRHLGPDLPGLCHQIIIDST